MGTSRKRKQAKAIDYDPQNPQSWPEDTPPIIEVDPEDQELSAAFASLPQNDACIELFRTSKVGGRPVFLEQLTPTMFQLSYIAEKFGGGIYVARAKYKDGTPIKCPFEIEGDPFPVKRVIPNPAMAPVQIPGPTPHHEPIILEDGSDKGLAQILTLLIRRMDQGETQMLERMKLYKELFGGNSKAETPLDTAISMFQKGLEMSAMSEGGGSPWMLLMREFREPLMKIVETVQVAVTRSQAPGARPAMPAGARPAPHAQPAQPASANPQPPDTGGSQSPPPPPSLAQQFAGFCPLLLTGASRNADPGSYAGVVLDQVPGSAYAELYDWLQTPGCLDQLVQIEPAIRFQMEWWEALRKDMIEILAEELGIDRSGPDADRIVQPVETTESPASDSTPGGPPPGAG